MLVLATISSFAAGAQFGNSSNAERCYQTGLTPDEKIAACQNVILSGLLDRTDAVGTYQNMGAAYEQKGDYPDALKAFSFAIRFSPRLWQAYYNRASVYAALGQFDAAFQDADKVIELRPTSSYGYDKRCWLHAAKNADLDQALADCNKGIELNGQDASLLDSRGFVYFRMTNYAAAIADCTNALALRPDMATSLYVRGLAKLRSGDAAGGTSDITAAKANDPAIVDTYASYGAKP